MKQERQTATEAAASPIPPEQRVQAAAIVTSGLVAPHGVDAGGIPPSDLAARALEIVDAICELVYAPPEQPPADAVAAAPPSEAPVADKAEAPRKHGWHR
jgi:hypothetical protein